MTDDNEIHTQVHRFGDTVATFVGTGETVYLSPAAARQYARALLAAASDVSARPFGPESRAGTFEMSTRDGRFTNPERDASGRLAHPRVTDPFTHAATRRSD